VEAKEGLYDVRKAAFAWYNTLRAALVSIGFTFIEADPWLFYRDGASGRV
jgi:hypothetical protein